MDWVRELYGTIVGLDTAPLIYFVESNTKYLPIVDPFFQAVERGDIRIVTSSLTLTEVLVHPLRSGNHNLAEAYSRILLNTQHLTTLAVSVDIAREAARLRSQYGLKTPDAIQVATALIGGASNFLTNDASLKTIPGLVVLCLEQLQRNS